MAAATTIIMAGAAVASTASQISKARSAKKQADKASAAIDDYERQELVNYAALQAPSTKGAEIQLDQLAKTTATQVAMAEKLGSRGIGAAAQISDRSDLVTQKVAAGVDTQQDEYKRLAAEGAMNVQYMQEQRESEDLAGLGTLYNTARQEQAAYTTGAASSLMNTASIVAQSGVTSPQSQIGVAPSRSQPTQYATEQPSGYDNYYNTEAQGFSYDSLLEDVVAEDPYYQFNTKY